MYGMIEPIINNRNIYPKVVSLRLEFSPRHSLASRRFHLNISQLLYIVRERYAICQGRVYSQGMAPLLTIRLS